jgi:hypothetical protein
VASGQNSHELILRNYRLGGQIEGKIEIKNKILQIEYTPCGEYIFVIESDGKVAVILSSDLTGVT